jgi:hypothetical protein
MNDSASTCKTYAAPFIALIGIVVGGVGWLIAMQSQISKVGAIQETVVKGQERHEGLIQGCQARTARIEVIESELAHLKEGFEEHRKLTEGKK